MRTRRSPRNQEILWRELGRQGAPPPPKPGKRERPHRLSRSALLVHIRVAGYHDDRKAYTRLIIENRINRSKANEEYQRGRKMKADGVPCACRQCNPTTYPLDGRQE